MQLETTQHQRFGAQRLPASCAAGGRADGAERADGQTGPSQRRNASVCWR